MEKAGDIGKLCCPPYDIISDSEREEFIKENPYNIIRLELPKGENPYEEAKETLNSWLEKGILKRDEKPAIYVYEEEFDHKGKRVCIKGLILCLKLEEFSKGIVLPHEFTLSKAKEDRLNLMKATNCNFSQIYGLYIDDTHTTMNTIEKKTKEMECQEFTDGQGITHRLWTVTSPSVIGKIESDFKDRKIYIADGHHRYETALNYRNYCRENGLAKEGDGVDYQMIFLADMDHPGLKVFPTHRLVRDLENFDEEAFLKKCEENFKVMDCEDISTMENTLHDLFRDNRKAFGYVGKTNKILMLKNAFNLDKMLPDMSKPTRELDVTVLHSLILENILGIDKENMANQINLTYTKIFQEAVDGVSDGKFQCAFILNPTKVTQIRDVALAGEKMPQKSTYFYPKMITGMVMNMLED